MPNACRKAHDARSHSLCSKELSSYEQNHGKQPYPRRYKLLFTAPFKAAYTYGAATEIGIFTQSVPERYLRLEGINTAQGNAKVLVELYRVAFDPLKEISFISDEYNKFELEGSLLADTTKPYNALLGQFGRIVQL